MSVNDINDTIHTYCQSQGCECYTYFVFSPRRRINGLGEILFYIIYK